ncbi:sterol desaturase family protein [Aestuariicella sp. G3-2]|uniref:sterol desaturase family protein n=1 Tax=Pseudomaricurvus albidus TaxID=2842452 RepID=UPI001C0DEF48|nr:sterol desaturase family protein [Aestuariicella albida]MBU3070736.1 sterol desaturase family protein [Aestuariicella albida]
MKDLILLLATPLFLLAIALELWVDRRRGTGYYRFNDAFGSLSLGILSRSSTLVIFSLGGLVIDRLLPQVRLMEWDSSSLWTWVFTFVAYDFMYYWLHRTGHSLNVFWAGHAIHHQSEDYNLTTALRQTSSEIWGWVFGVPLLMLGIPLEVYLTCGALNLIYQFWVHTQHIDKLGWMEHVMVTPSNHRVHHGQNPEYIDKNHGGVFIVWDRLFGTFQPELDHVETIYGARSPLHSLNPVWANCQVWFSLVRDAWHTASWWDKCRIWFMPTGWRPADVQQAYPSQLSDLDNFHKYNPSAPRVAQWYCLFQLAAAVPLLVFFLEHYKALSYSQVLLGFVLITLPLITTAWLLEGRREGWESTRLIVSWVVLALAWNLMSPDSAMVFGGYLLLNSIVYLVLFKSDRFVLKERRAENG